MEGANWCQQGTQSAVLQIRLAFNLDQFLGGVSRRKFIQTKLPFGNRVIRGDSLLVSPLTNKKSGLKLDRGETATSKKMKVSQYPDGESKDFGVMYIWKL
jgi:hypothetical protein